MTASRELHRETIERPGFTLSALVTGPQDAPPVLLMNSFGAEVGMWDSLRRRLDPTRRVIGFDTRGHGLSEAPEGPYDFDDLVGDATAVLDHFGLAQADVVGLSLGGMTALGLGLASPDRVTRIVCCAARADAPPAFVQQWDDRMAKVAEGGPAAIWPGTRKVWLTEDTPEAEVARLEKGFLATSPQGYAGCARALQGLDYLRHLGELRVPVHYIAGELDIGAPPAAMQAMADATPGASFDVIPGAAHLVNVTRPAPFEDLVATYLEA